MATWAGATAPTTRRAARALLALCLLLPAVPAAAASGPAAIVVTSLKDLDPPPAGKTTLRSAVRRIAPGGRITFAAALNGRTVELDIVGEAHSLLGGEYFDPATMQFVDFRERDYGRSALYARKDLVIDASALPDGITLRWSGGDALRARVLAVLGDLTLRNVTVTGGHAASEPIPESPQLHTLGRGGGIAVWGTARLSGCTVAGNRAAGDENGSRDRGAFGGGIYANLALLRDCVVSGNAVTGYGAAGGGVYSVGGAGFDAGGSRLERCAITGNRITGEHAYGGGVYSDGGGPGNNRAILLKNCTIARNVVEDHPALNNPVQPGSQYYYRGGGFYMSNGSLTAQSCTIVQNEVTGVAAVFKGRPNMGGGGVGATIGNAHVVEEMRLQHSLVAGNTVGGAADDVYTGSLVLFTSLGHNLVGKIDFSQILVPIPAWASLSRKHWPKAGDRDGVAVADALDFARARTHRSILSAGVAPGDPALLWAPPAGPALDAVPPSPYHVRSAVAEYTGAPLEYGAFLNGVVAKVSADYADELGPDFAAGFADMTGTDFSAVPRTWPGVPANAPWIAFWRDLEAQIGGRLGAPGLADAFWASWDSPGWSDFVSVMIDQRAVGLAKLDQRGRPRPAGGRGDVGAIER